MTRLQAARNWLARAEADAEAFAKRKAAGIQMRGMYEDLTVGRSLVNARHEVAEAEAEEAALREKVGA